MSQLSKASNRTIDRTTTVTDYFFRSTDMGNISQIIPAIHPMISLSEGLTPHTREFATAANGPAVQKTISDGAIILAATALSMFREPQILTDAQEAFTDTKTF